MSIITQRLKELEAKFVDSTEYIDLNIFGVYTSTVTGNYELAVHRDFALINSVKMWMLSRTGDYYREPTKGGIIDLLLGAPMEPSNYTSLSNEIAKKFADNFNLVELINLNLEADPVLKIWHVRVKVLDIINKRALEFSIGLEV